MLACAAVGCGGDEKESKKPAGGEESPDGEDPGGNVNPGIPTNNAKPTPIADIDEDKKLVDLDDGEVKGLCLAVLAPTRAIFAGSCREGALMLEDEAACKEQLAGCEESADDIGALFPDDYCNLVSVPGEGCKMTVSDYRACLADIEKFYAGLTCESPEAVDNQPDCQAAQAECNLSFATDV